MVIKNISYQGSQLQAFTLYRGNDYIDVLLYGQDDNVASVSVNYEGYCNVTGAKFLLEVDGVTYDMPDLIKRLHEKPRLVDNLAIGGGSYSENGRYYTVIKPRRIDMQFLGELHTGSLHVHYGIKKTDFDVDCFCKMFVQPNRGTAISMIDYITNYVQFQSNGVVTKGYVCTGMCDGRGRIFNLTIENYDIFSDLCRMNSIIQGKARVAYGRPFYGFGRVDTYTGNFYVHNRYTV